MIASSSSPFRYLVSSLEPAEPAVPGTLEIEELPVETTPRLVSVPPFATTTSIIEIDRKQLTALALRRGLGRFLAGFGRR